MHPGLGRTPRKGKMDGEKAPSAPAVFPLGSLGLQTHPGFCLQEPGTWWVSLVVDSCCYPRKLCHRGFLPGQLPISTPGHVAPPISEPLTHACCEQSPTPQSMCTHTPLLPTRHPQHPLRAHTDPMPAHPPCGGRPSSHPTPRPVLRSQPTALLKAPKPEPTCIPTALALLRDEDGG